MTGDNTSRLPAGPELDAMVSRLIFGHGWYQAPYIIINGNRTEGPQWIEDGYTPDQPGGGAWAGQRPLCYSGKIAPAMRVVEKLSDRFKWQIQSPTHIGGMWRVGVQPLSVIEWLTPAFWAADFEHLPAAICKAALYALEGENATKASA